MAFFSSSQLSEFSNLKSDKGMKNILFFPQKSKIFKKRAWGEYLHPYGTSEISTCGFWDQKYEIFVFGQLPQSVPAGCKYAPQALFEQLLGSFMPKEAFWAHLEGLAKNHILVIYGPQIDPKVGSAEISTIFAHVWRPMVTSLMVAHT